MRLWGIAFACLVGCYSPDVRDCTVACGSESDCAPGQRCVDGTCTGGAACEGTPATPDATTATGDGMDLCALGCSRGTCVDGVCVIDCSAPDSCQSVDIRCEPNLPCRVECGDRACAKKVLCEDATSCEVVCSGVDACSEEIQCGIDRPCNVSCTGERSCKKKIKCGEACACDATCSGALSCAEVPECPLESTCRLGAGCTSALPGCNRCE